MSRSLSLSRLLKDAAFPRLEDQAKGGAELKVLQLKMLRAQQGIWHKPGRAIIAIEGFDASGKGGAIRRLTEMLDPRGVKVYPIGPPTPSEQGRHYLYRFWKNLPPPGGIAVFDRTWYGRVLVERVEELVPKKIWNRGYHEINEQEKFWVEDGIILIKIFLAISKSEQLSRFEARLQDPYKRWKLTKDDLRARAKWDRYVEAVDAMLEQTNTKLAPWLLVPADDKHHARSEVLRAVTERLGSYAKWMEDGTRQVMSPKEVKKALRYLK